MVDSNFPVVKLSAVLITRGPAILTMYNPRWGAFTLPMTKHRTWQDPRVSDMQTAEDPLTAAIRAGAEALGRPFKLDDLPERVEIDVQGPFHQSGRDGTWKSYYFDVYEYNLAASEDPASLGGSTVAWLTPEQLETARPVSPTAVAIASAYRGAKILQGGR